MLLATQAAIREHLVGNLGVLAEELDPPARPSGRGRLDRMVDTDGYGDEEGVQDEEDGQQVIM